MNKKQVNKLKTRNKNVTKLLGRIKWFNTTKGFGFVTDCHSNEDVFVHHSGIQVQSNCWKSLHAGRI